MLTQTQGLRRLVELAELDSPELVYTFIMYSSRALLVILLSLALFVQGVAASTLRSCYMRSAAVAQGHDHASHQHGHAASDDGSMSSQHHDHTARSAHHTDDSDKSTASKLASCASCAACCMSLALPVVYATSPEIIVGTRTVFPPLVVAPPSRLPGGWDRPPRT